MSDCEPCFNLALHTSRISTCPNFSRILSAKVPSTAFASCHLGQKLGEQSLIAVLDHECKQLALCVVWLCLPIDLIRETISYYVIHLRMAKAHKCPLAAVCTAVSGEAWKAVALGSFDSPRPRTWWYCRNGRRQLIVVLVEIGSLLLLPQVAIASKSVWMVYLLGNELGSLLRDGNPYCTLRPLPSFTAIWL